MSSQTHVKKMERSMKEYQKIIKIKLCKKQR